MLFTFGFRAVFTGHAEAKSVTIGDLMLTGSTVLAIPFLRYGPIAVVVVASASSLVNFLVQWRLIKRLSGAHPIVDIPLWKELIKGGMPFCINNYLLQAYSFVSVFVVRHLVGEAGVGVTGQVSRIFGTFMFIPTALIAALLPMLAKLAHTDMETFDRTKLRVLALLVVLGLPVAVLLYMLAPPLCQLLYSKRKFVDMPVALQVMSFAIIPMYVVSTMYQFLVAQGRAQVWARFLALTVVIYAVVALVSIPITTRVWRNGPAGASMAMVVAESISMVASLLLMKVDLVNRDLFTRMVKAAVAAGSMVAAMAIARSMVVRYFPGEDGLSAAIQLIICGATGTFVFATLAWTLRILWPQDQEKMAQMAGKLLRRFRRPAEGAR
jgi:stage V sporulation protein B